jgi:hypothetical protein
MAGDSCDEVLDAMAASLRALLADLRAMVPEGMDVDELSARAATRPAEGVHTEECWIQSALSHLLIALDPPDEPEPVGAAPDGTLYRLELLCEVRSEAEVDRLVDAMKTAACPYGDAEDHECPVPWMTMAERIGDDDEEAAGIREMLNRR